MNKMNQSRIKQAVEILNKGGIVVYPTETVYGIGCDPFNPEACERVQHIKKRKDKKTLLLLACSLSQVESFAGKLKGISQRLADIFWPGPLTIVINPQKQLPDYLYGISKGVAFRVTSDPVAASLASEFGYPITSTSANMSGHSPILTYKEALDTFGDSADIILKNLEPLRGRPSTVIDLTSNHLAIIREGSITRSRLDEVL